MSVPKRVSAMGPDGTELNLDGISKPELEKIPEARAKELTELSMNICKLSTLENLPSLPSLFKLSLNDNNLTSITGLAEKCPVLLELYLSGNKKISSLDQLDEISKIKSLLKIEIEGCGVQDTEGENYRDKIFKKFPHLQVVDSYNEQGEEMPDDDDEEEEDEEVADRNSIIKSEEDDEGPGLAALLGGDLDSDEDDDNYDSNEEPEGSDGDNDIEEDDDEQEDGAGPSSKPGSSGLSSGPPAKRQKTAEPDSDSD